MGGAGASVNGSSKEDQVGAEGDAAPAGASVAELSAEKDDKTGEPAASSSSSSSVEPLSTSSSEASPSSDAPAYDSNADATMLVQVLLPAQIRTAKQVAMLHRQTSTPPTPTHSPSSAAAADAAVASSSDTSSSASTSALESALSSSFDKPASTSG